MREKIILGTESVFRQEVFRRYCGTFIKHSPKIDEKSIRADTINNTVIAIAYKKAQTVFEWFHATFLNKKSRRLIVCGDQVFECDRKQLEKPDTVDEVVRRLKMYPDKKVATVSGVCVMDTLTGRYIVGVDRVAIQILPFTDKEIDQICNNSLTFKTCAALPSGIPGDQTCQMVEMHKIFDRTKEESVLGLPMGMIIPMAKNLGFESLAPRNNA